MFPGFIQKDCNHYSRTFQGLDQKFKDFSRENGIQGLPLKFKVFSRLCEPWSLWSRFRVLVCLLLKSLCRIFIEISVLLHALRGYLSVNNTLLFLFDALVVTSSENMLCKSSLSPLGELVEARVVSGSAAKGTDFLESMESKQSKVHFHLPFLDLNGKSPDSSCISQFQLRPARVPTPGNLPSKAQKS